MSTSSWIGSSQSSVPNSAEESALFIAEDYSDCRLSVNSSRVIPIKPASRNPGRDQTAGSAGGRSLCWVRRGVVSQTRRVWRLRQMRRVEYLALLHTGRSDACLLAEGLTSKAIGRQLFIAPSTVAYHLTSIFNKLGVESRAQAVAVAARHGLL